MDPDLGRADLDDDYFGLSNVPPIGDCQTEDGTMHPAFNHDNTHGQGTRIASAKARAICEGCPVLKECQDWAAQFSDWAAITVAGWSAPAGFGHAPPWAEKSRGRRQVKNGQWHESVA